MSKDDSPTVKADRLARKEKGSQEEDSQKVDEVLEDEEVSVVVPVGQDSKEEEFEGVDEVDKIKNEKEYGL